MDAREAELIYEAGNDAVIKAFLEMDASIRALEQQILVLQKKIASLSSNSTNSSKPPSSEGPQVSKPKKKKSKRSAGGQKGHKGHKRALLPVEEMDNVFDHYPSTCTKCGAPLDLESCEETSEPERYQTFELPQIKPISSEHRCHELELLAGSLRDKRRASHMKATEVSCVSERKVQQAQTIRKASPELAQKVERKP